MTDDIVTRLRDPIFGQPLPVREAADEIERLRGAVLKLSLLAEEIPALRAALTGRTVSCGACGAIEKALRLFCNGVALNLMTSRTLAGLDSILRDAGLWREPEAGKL
ncbi:MAG: hypothetical protein WAT39_01555 [Planctomycetota bacterium]